MQTPHGFDQWQHEWTQQQHNSDQLASPNPSQLSLTPGFSSPATRLSNHFEYQSSSPTISMQSPQASFASTRASSIADSPPDTPDSLNSGSGSAGSSSSTSEHTREPPIHHQLPTHPTTTRRNSRALSVKTEPGEHGTHHTPPHQSHHHHPHSHHHGHGGSGLTAQQQAEAHAEQQRHRAAEAAEEEDDEEDAGTGGGGVSESKMKRGHGSSCHQCKTTKDPQFLFFCTNKAEKGVRKRRCRKKYCDSCLKRSYGNDASEIIPSWQCPSCLGVCICAACHRKSSRKTSAPVAPAPPTNSANSAQAQQAEHVRAQEKNRMQHQQHMDDSPDGGLSMPQNKRSVSNSSARISLSPLTISRSLSQDPHERTVKTERPGSAHGDHRSPRYSSRSLLTGKGNSSSSENIAAMDQDSGNSGLAYTLDPFQQQNEELERLMVGMNMQQRQTFLHDAANLVTNGNGPQGKFSNSPRGSPRAPKRKLGQPSAPTDLTSPTQQVKYHMQQRLKNQLSNASEDSTPSGLPPSHTPNSSSRRLGGGAGSSSAMSVLTSPTGLSHRGTSPNHMLPLLSTPSLATHLPDEGFDVPSSGHSNGQGSSSSSGGLFSPPASMFQSSAADLAPAGGFSVSIHGSSSHSGGSLPRPVTIKNEPEYLQWGGMNSSTSGSHGSNVSMSILATPNPSFLSPLPGSLMLSYPQSSPISGGGGVPVTPGGGSGMLLGSPNPLHNSAFIGVTPGSSTSSAFFSPNPASLSSSPNPYGSAMVYPSSYLPPSESSFPIRQMSSGGANVIMGDGGMERGMSAMNPLSMGDLTSSACGVDGMWNQDASAWRQTSANANMMPTTPSAVAVP